MSQIAVLGETKNSDTSKKVAHAYSKFDQCLYDSGLINQMTALCGHVKVRKNPLFTPKGDWDVYCNPCVDLVVAHRFQ